MAATYTLGKEERLKNNMVIQDLLKNGRTETLFPLKFYWKPSKDPRQRRPVRFAVLVPRRKFRRAVDRNLMKRRIREACRRNKNILYPSLYEKNLKINLIILLLADEFITFERMDGCTRDLFTRLVENL
jgi:ribonuclease P protein component